MANIHVGFHDQRSCNRILKPPGGGTSDIFGTDAQIKRENEHNCALGTPTKESVPQQKEVYEQKSDDNNSVDNNKHEEKISNSESPKIENLSINEGNEEKPIQPIEAKGEAKPDTIGNIIRQNDQGHSPVADTGNKTPQRVPPGGYSSGLW